MQPALGDAAAGAAERVGRADDRRKQPNVFKGGDGAFEPLCGVVAPGRELWGSDDRCFRVFESDPVHRLAEELAVFGHFGGAALRAMPDACCSLLARWLG